MTAETDQTNPDDVETPTAPETETAPADDAEATAQETANDADSDAPGDSSAEADEQGDVEVNSIDFQALEAGTNSSGKPADLNRFQEIKVTVSADLGRASIPLQTLMNLGEGSVLELDRKIDSPIELVAQGVPLASGEVVVVNGCFAIRVTKVYEGQTG